MSLIPRFSKPTLLICGFCEREPTDEEKAANQSANTKDGDKNQLDFRHVQLGVHE
jgi:hypothetical protein